ncbi:bifunctional UDP-N-acetylglucosamine diphosphorylase/glucosamine-1-phosphate N-acetyltransferase GlmU [Bacterioplanoides sp.]|uniref:bifunctional UDP-N-acetylglucosamine diphosphorylase/glucosamine-1-phosphate N-acetyltransferase GlmU n=1 Tax=Bacterioplanoides sp. TaxID=2066072 RepID=UPI003AFFCF4E
MTLAVVTLAAGKGSRMKSDLPKVLHPLAGQPMLAHVLASAAQLGEAKQHVVIGHGAEKVREQIRGFDVSWAMQTEQKGTGHAVAQAMPEVDSEATVLVLYGDVPLIQTDTLQKLLDETHQGQNLALLTVELADPSGYGRIVRDAADNIQAIVEHKDATAEQHQIREVNTGILAVSARLLNEWLPKLSANNAQGEYYLTDIIAMAVDHGVAVRAIHPHNEYEVQGVNDRLQLAELERVFQRQQADELMRQGVSLADPARIDIRGSLTVGADVRIDVGCVFEGDVTLADGVHIGPYCVIKNAVVGAATQVESHSLIDQANVAADCTVGPFARLRPGAELADGAKVGNFCEVKKAVIGPGSKVNHLTYIGDAEIGANANIGAGTITCNYDGVNKFKTEIGDNAFIGSNSSLVAPVKVGADATVAAGSVVTKEVADGELAVARGKQRNVSGWQRPVKK